MHTKHDFGRGALAVMRQSAPGLAVTVAAAPSTLFDGVTDAPTVSKSTRLHRGNVGAIETNFHPHLYDLRALPFAERGLIPDSELVRLADSDVPGAETEISLRAILKKTGIERLKVKPHFVKA